VALQFGAKFKNYVHPHDAITLVLPQKMNEPPVNIPNFALLNPRLRAARQNPCRMFASVHYSKFKNQQSSNPQLAASYSAHSDCPANCHVITF
jgi:hypothetical protein